MYFLKCVQVTGQLTLSHT